jgi:hypothetical protein
MLRRERFGSTLRTRWKCRLVRPVNVRSIHSIDLVTRPPKQSGLDGRVGRPAQPSISRRFLRDLVGAEAEAFRLVLELIVRQGAAYTSGLAIVSA